MTPKKYDFSKQYKGDTFKGVQMTFTKTDGGVTSPMDLTGAVINMNFRINPATDVVKAFVNGSGITVTDAVNGVVNIDKFLVTLPPARYIYDLKITLSDGTISTYLTGIFEVQPNQS